jgi:FkbM family methyltransferase
MKIYYGLKDNCIDVTLICYDKLLNNNKIIIPSGDINRAKYFGDPLYGVLKSIIIINENNEITEYDHTLDIHIDVLNNNIINTKNNDINSKINDIHSKLQIKYGSFRDELPEQKMSVRYLTGNEKVLEIGGNIGRNSLIIGHILKDKNNNFVTLECDEGISNQLKENRDLNNMTFHIENSALSKRKLIQRGWDTIVSDVLLPGYKSVNTITLEQLRNKYNIDFDTLVLDCEGAFFYILLDMPEILDNINLIIMENDYHNINHKKYIDDVLKQHNFYVDYSESGGWGPCYNNFFEVWKRG